MVSSGNDSPGPAMDDLSVPLGQSQLQPHSAALSRAIAAALGLGLLLFVLWIALVGNPFEPVALAPAARPVEAAAPVPQPAPEPKASAVVPEPAGKGASPRTVTIIDGMSGKRQEVVIGGSSDAAQAPAGRRPR
jgi:hypothetical protein